jgi:hypothetical protein
VDPLKCQAAYLFRFIVLTCRALFFFFKEEFIQATILERTAIGQDDPLEEMRERKM